MTRQELREKLRQDIGNIIDEYCDPETWKISDQILHLIDEYAGNPDKVDRFEVIDDDGRAYVKGSIYGSPVKVKLSYQDGSKTLKVFVSHRAGIGEK